MIVTVARKIQVYLTSIGCPYPVIYGPERRGLAFTTQPRFVVERDRTNADTWSAPGKSRPNPVMMAIRTVPCKTTIFAQSTVNGATTYDHERLADAMVDHFFVGLKTVASNLHTLFEVSSSKIMSEDEIDSAGLEAWPGVVSVIEWTIDRAVNNVDWAGEKADEYTLAAGTTVGGGFSIVGEVGLSIDTLETIPGGMNG